MSSPIDLAKINQQVERRRAKRCQQKRADGAEAIVRNRLIALGFVEVAKIETGRDFRGKHVRKVAGDITFLSPIDGRGGLCEVKSHQKDRLLWSDLRPHQTLRLDAYIKANAWAILAWVGPHGACLMSWRFLRSTGFATGQSISGTVALAACLHVPLSSLSHFYPR